MRADGARAEVGAPAIRGHNSPLRTAVPAAPPGAAFLTKART